MKEMYKDNAGNWHYGYKGEKLTEVSYSANSVPNSIPVEWIKKWAKKNGLDCYDYDYPTEKNDWWYAIEKMLEDWGRENG